MVGSTLEYFFLDDFCGTILPFKFPPVSMIFQVQTVNITCKYSEVEPVETYQCGYQVVPYKFMILSHLIFKIGRGI